MANDLDDILNDEDDLASFFEEDATDGDDDLASLFAEEDDDSDDLASFFADDNDTEDDADLASFFDGDDDDNKEEENDLASFFAEEPSGTDNKDTTDLASFFGNDDDDDDDDDGGGLFGEILGAVSGKPEPILPYKKEKRKAKLDVTKSSKEDHRNVKRYTKSELDEQLKRDYKYMLGKPYMVIQPVTIMADYPYKKKKSNSDAIESYNVEYDYALVIGKLLKWRSTEQFTRKPYKLGEIMYMKRGVYWVNGTQMRMEPHFAIVLHRSYKRIKTKRIRDMLAPLKQRLRTGKPFSIYKEFPILIERTGVFS
ncbi:MAG: Unknown protein [uncultured Aureispira sp.]|uniref:Uncharacterized protein n=1 Tax=uncultured Aureispira sp. TaxID=1331704 RepID=A0A6S6TLJ1_9BACT|nr:MAG: Unknown protein [uncultured Aureispira sp.]